MVDAVSEYNAEQHVHIADARQAVIEAAKAWLDRRDGPTDEQLKLTVEALQAAEGEEQ